MSASINYVFFFSTRCCCYWVRSVTCLFYSFACTTNWSSMASERSGWLIKSRLWPMPNQEIKMSLHTASLPFLFFVLSFSYIFSRLVVGTKTPPKHSTIEVCTCCVHMFRVKIFKRNTLPINMLQRIALFSFRVRFKHLWKNPLPRQRKKWRMELSRFWLSINSSVFFSRKPNVNR